MTPEDVAGFMYESAVKFHEGVIVGRGAKDWPDEAVLAVLRTFADQIREEDALLVEDTSVWGEYPLHDAAESIRSRKVRK